MLVTPLRDGMNLVAKEYVAARGDGGGVLVLSEFAGAASELAEALQVNPFDIESTATTLYQALKMPPAETRRRMRAMRRRVFAFDTDLWVNRFVRTLTSIAGGSVIASEQPTAAATLERIADEVASAERLVLLLDYDGTLAPIARTPDLAAPDEELLSLLAALCRRPKTETHVVSGRSVATLQTWLGDLPVGLHAEHGISSRHPGATEWDPPPTLADAWREPVLTILREFAERAPGSLVEEKDWCVAWHYRAAEPVFAEKQARELKLHLLPLLSNAPVELVSGRAVIEIRPQGYHKGRIVERVRATMAPGTSILAMGDDDTDEDMFAAIDAETGMTIHVGPGPSRARARIASVRGARSFLHAILVTPRRHSPALARESASRI
jgi:trehalose 6-phosphate synthase/phosphatase